MSRDYLLFLLSFLIINVLKAVQLDLTVNAEAAILMNASTGAILYEKNAHQQLHPASITKIATAAYALEVASNRLQETIAAPREALASISSDAKRASNYKMPSYWLEHGGTHIGLKNGEEMSLENLLYGLMLSSGNDAANVIAFSVGGTIPQFTEEVNVYLQKLGCVNTHFCNPHGLHHPEHLTTANDMAILTCRAMKNPVFRKIVATTRYTRPKTNKQEASILIQSNRLLKSGQYFYPKAIGVKTGYISMAQKTLVAAAVQDDRMLIAVLLKCKKSDEIFSDAIKLFETAFNQPRVERLLLKEGETEHHYFPEGAQKAIKTKVADSVTIRYFPAEEPELTASLAWKSVNFPVEVDACVGEITIQTSKGKTLCKVPLYAMEEVNASWSHWLFKGR